LGIPGSGELETDIFLLAENRKMHISDEGGDRFFEKLPDEYESEVLDPIEQADAVAPIVGGSIKPGSSLRGNAEGNRANILNGNVLAT
jgi:hypothetical protein